jgi:hypothetical protein
MGGWIKPQQGEISTASRITRVLVFVLFVQSLKSKVSKH